MPIAKIDEVVAALREGRMIILADDEQRENEGDFVMVAQLATPEAISFMAEHARTIITLALTAERCDRLQLPLMPADSASHQDTAFTITIEAAAGVTTGSSAKDRAHTVRTAVAADARADDLVRPGHVFPLRAVPGGVLNRAGHTEAACDLARLAGFEPAGLISEIQLADGTMARLPQLQELAEQHGLPLGTIASLIAYRCQTESLVRRIDSGTVTTPHGDFQVAVYEDTIAKARHVALIKGSLDAGGPPLVRVLTQPNILDCLAYGSAHRSWSVAAALRRIAAEDSGVLLGLHVDAPLDLELSGQRSTPPSGDSQQVRTYGFGAQILRDLGVADMRLLSAPLRLPSMEGYGLNIVEIIQPDKADG